MKSKAISPVLIHYKRLKALKAEYDTKVNEIELLVEKRREIELKYEQYVKDNSPSTTGIMPGTKGVFYNINQFEASEVVLLANLGRDMVEQIDNFDKELSETIKGVQ